jgi:putative hemolysin
MNNSSYQEWLIILLIIAVNSLFVIAEIAILTSRKTKLQKLSNDGSIGASKALILKEQPEVFLSTVQVGITLMSIIIGFYSGSRISGDIAELIKHIPLINIYANAMANFLVICIITFFTVLGEIIPKRIGMLYPEKYACFISLLMLLFSKLFYPFIYALSASTKFILKLLKVKERPSEITPEEIKMIVSQAEHEGMVDKTERDMIRRLIHLSDMKVGAIMTPRKQIIYLDIQDSDEDNLKKLAKYSFNYFPVIDGSLDKLVGLLSVKDLFNTKITNKSIQLKAQILDILFIPEVARLTKLLELFREKQFRIAIALDEYGEIEGIVTFNDILKTFVGDLATQEKGQTPSIVNRKDGSFMVNGNVQIEVIMELLQLTSLPGEDEEDYRTISSFILKQLNRLPKVGDSFEAAGYIFKVIKMEKFRIDKILIKSQKLL